MKLTDQSVNGLAVGRSLRPPEAFAKAPKKQGLTSFALLAVRELADKA